MLGRIVTDGWGWRKQRLSDHRAQRSHACVRSFVRLLVVAGANAVLRVNNPNCECGHVHQRQLLRSYREQNWSAEAVQERVRVAQEKSRRREEELMRRVAGGGGVKGDGGDAGTTGATTTAAGSGAAGEERPIFGDKEILSANNFYTDNLQQRVRVVRWVCCVRS